MTDKALPGPPAPLTCPVRDGNWCDREAGLQGRVVTGEAAQGMGPVKSSAVAHSALQRVPGGWKLTLQASVCHRSQHPSPLKLGARGGSGRRGERRLLSQPRNVLSSWGGCQLWPGPQAPTRHFLCPWPPPTPPPRFCAPGQIGKGYERHPG